MNGLKIVNIVSLKIVNIVGFKIKSCLPFCLLLSVYISLSTSNTMQTF